MKGDRGCYYNITPWLDLDLDFCDWTLSFNWVKEYVIVLFRSMSLCPFYMQRFLYIHSGEFFPHSKNIISSISRKVDFWVSLLLWDGGQPPYKYQHVPAATTATKT